MVADALMGLLLLVVSYYLCIWFDDRLYRRGGVPVPYAWLWGAGSVSLVYMWLGIV